MNLTFTARVGHRYRALRSRWRIFLSRAAGAQIQNNCFIGKNCDLMPGGTSERRGRIELKEGCTLLRDVVLYPYGGSIRLGAHVHLGVGVVVYGHGGVEIGEHSLVAPHCRIFSSNHTVPENTELIRSKPDMLLPTKIGRDVWLGAGVTVLGGVCIGDGCVVGAGSVVTKDLPAGTIAHGIPATVQRQRFKPTA
ncbi:acyltransferase [Oleiharenicola lentus]|uniref:acyltransferase n=1 Tax=Oleiharenicola lentus TaxID=2508720 RepID=UPI003F673452